MPKSDLPTNSGEWSEYQKLVMYSIADLKTELKASVDRSFERNELIQKHLADIRTEIALLKLKSSFWGAVSGLGAYVLLWVAELLRRRP